MGLWAILINVLRDADGRCLAAQGQGCRRWIFQNMDFMALRNPAPPVNSAHSLLNSSIAQLVSLCRSSMWLG